MAIELILEVLRHAPSDLTPQERLAAVVFAEDARVWGPGNRLDRKIFTPLDDEKYQVFIGVSSADKVKKLAQSLARKGVLESVTRGQKGQVAEYRIARLTSQQDSIRTTVDSSADTGPLNDFSSADTAGQQSGNRPAYSPSRKTPLPADVPGHADAASSEARQAGETHTPNTTPAQPTTGQVDPRPAVPAGRKAAATRQ